MLKPFASARSLTLALLACVLLASNLLGAPFTPGNLVVYRQNDGAAALTNTGTAVFLDEYTTLGALVQSIAVPTTTVGSQRRLVCSGSATSEGFLSRSSDGQYVVFSGYDAALATASITSSSSATVPRVIGRVAADGTIDTTTALTDAISGGNPRSAASTNGTDLWLSGSTSSVRYATFGATTSTGLAASPTNLRALGIFGGQLYVSANTTTFHLMTVGTGTPTTSGQTLTNLPGFPTTGSQYGFFFADLDAGVAGVDTVYVADDGGTIQKFSLVGGNWTANGTIALTSARGLTGTVSGSNVTLYVTARTTLRTLTDTSGYNATITGALTTLATAATNTAIQGIAFVPASAGPNLSINDVSLNEGNAGTTSFTFTVSLSAPAGPGGVTFDIATANNTAAQPGDYTLNSLTSQTIPAGSSTYSFTVLVNGDTTPETNETFFVNVTNVTGATVTDGQGQGTIVNDDVSCATLSINDVTQVETDAGTTNFAFTVSLSQAGCGTVTFDIATQDNTATTAGIDYVGQTLNGQTITFPSTYTFNVTVNGDVTTEPDQTFFVNLTNVSPANVQVGDSQGMGTIQNDDYTRIHDIQGPGGSSPLAGSVTTRGIVTGRKSNGFFLQEPDASVDADPMTSEGILVFTSSAPSAAAAVGNYVEVTGTISEFVPSADVLQPPVTELTSPTVVQLTTGNPLPVPIPLTASFPDPAGGFDQLERLEGMRVSVASLTTSSPTLGNSTNEPNATQTSNGVFFGTVTGVPRPQREPGIQAPDPAPSGGSIPPIPRFDANPEMLRIDSDGLTGAPILDVNSLATVTGLVGPLDYTFRHYTILPDPTLPAPIAAGGMTATAATAPTGKEFTVGSYNVERFFDTNNNPAIGEPVLTATAYNNRLNKVSLGIRNNLLMPDILGMVEVEDLATLQDIATRVNNDAVAAAQPNPMYTAFLVEGNDVGGIDVGFLVKTALVDATTPRVTVNAVVQENAGELFVNADSSTEPLNDRPSLRLDAVVNAANGATFPVQVIVNHLRSLIGVNDESAGSSGWPTVGARVRAKRLKQAESLANLLQVRQTNNPAESIILVGDFNAYEFNDGLADTMEVIAGTPVPDNETAVPGDGVDLVNPDFDNLFDTPPAGERYSYVFDGQTQNIDHGIVNAALIAATSARRLEHPRINTDFQAVDRNDPNTARHLSDHDPLVGYFEVAAFGSADVSLTKTDSPDPVNAGQNLTYTITVANVGPDAADTSAWSDTLPIGTTFVSLSSPGGWSCTTPAVGAGGTISCSIASLPVSSAAFTLTALVDPSVAAGTVLSNTATVTSTTADPTTGNESATATTTVATSADLSVTKVDTPDPVDAGSNITYTVTATNAGPSNAASVTLGDTLPAGTTFVSLSSPGGWSCSTPSVGSAGAISCTNSSMAVGFELFTLTVTVDGSVADGTVITNTATVASSTSDPNTGNESASATTTVSTIGVSINDVPVTEGNAGTTPATFTVTLARAAGATITLNYATANDTASAGSDYTTAAGTVTFVPGDTSETVTVQVTGDTTDEPNETFFVNLSGVSGPGSLTDAQGLGTITDDDGEPTISIANASALEGSGGGLTPMTFTVSLSNPSVSTITVDAATAAGTATPANDYSTTSQTITFLPGIVMQSFVVPVIDDVDIESSEAFFVNLSAPVNATLADGQAIGTITDDDETLDAPDPKIIANCEPVIGGPCVLTVGSLSGASQRYWYYQWFVVGVASGSLPSLEPRLTAPGSYVIVVVVTGLDGQTGTATITITIPDPCPAGRLCLHDKRFEVSLVATDQRTGAMADGVPLRENDHFGHFALPGLTGDTDNPEVFVKILDGTSINGHFWVFYGGLTDLGYVLTVVDKESGETKSYTKPGGSSAGGFDVGSGVTPEECVGEVDGEPGLPAVLTGCGEGTDRLCLLGGRFKVTLTARDQRTGNTAQGVSMPKNDLFGYFSLPGLTGDPTNPEVFVKVLDGTPVNGHNWIFFAGLTDLEYTLTVVDVTTGSLKTYTKKPGSACGGFDTNGL
ncbi:MAG: Calx-beta domain-containing protein [Thermoanaerobaculia bacterium]